MREYFIDIDLRASGSEEFMSLIPQQRAVVNDLMSEGKLISYAVSADRTKLWIIMPAKNEKEVLDILESFPLIDFMNFEIRELLFHNSNQQAFSHISLN